MDKPTMNSHLQLNLRDHTTWAGLFGFVSTVAFSIPNPTAQVVGQVSAGIATAIMTAFTVKPTALVVDTSTPLSDVVKAGRL